MNEKKIAFEQRLEQNSKNYSPKDLFHLEDAEEMLSQLKESYGQIGRASCRERVWLKV